MNPTHLLVIFVFLSSVCFAELRTWRAVNGKSLKAKFVSLNDGKVTLKPTTGKEFKVDLSKLSEADQEYIKDLEKPEYIIHELGYLHNSKNLSNALSKAINIDDTEWIDKKRCYKTTKKPVTGWVAWFTNGKLSSISQNKDGIVHGLSAFIFPEGKYINKESMYKNGIKNGPEKDYVFGILSKESIYKNGKRVLFKIHNYRDKPKNIPPLEL